MDEPKKGQRVLSFDTKASFTVITKEGVETQKVQQTERFELGCSMHRIPETVDGYEDPEEGMRQISKDKNQPYEGGGFDPDCLACQVELHNTLEHAKFRGLT